MIMFFCLCVVICSVFSSVLVDFCVNEFSVEFFYTWFSIVRSYQKNLTY